MHRKWHVGQTGRAQCMNVLRVVWVELLFMRKTPYARVGDIQGMGIGSSTRRWVVVYVLKDGLFIAESAAHPSAVLAWKIPVSRNRS